MRNDTELLLRESEGSAWIYQYLMDQHWTNANLLHRFCDAKYPIRIVPMKPYITTQTPKQSSSKERSV